MRATELIEKARAFAQRVHKGQKRDDGQDYYGSHLYFVAHAVDDIVDDHEVVAATFLHDVLEDTDVTLEELEREFGKRVATLVHMVTHEGDRKTGYTFPRLNKEFAGLDMFRCALTIKLVDRAHNVYTSTAWGEERQIHYMEKTTFKGLTPKE